MRIEPLRVRDEAKYECLADNGKDRDKGIDSKGRDRDKYKRLSDNGKDRDKEIDSKGTETETNTNAFLTMVRTETKR